MGKIAGKVPKLQEKLFDFPYFRQKFDRLFLSPYRLKKKEQSATVPKDVYCYRYCFLETKECMHNEVGTCPEILPKSCFKTQLNRGIDKFLRKFNILLEFRDTCYFGILYSFFVRPHTSKPKL